MLRKIEIGGWILEVDRELTASTYLNLTLISEECPCTYCLNFVTAYAHFPPAIKEFFDQFGIDPRKEGEVYEYHNDGESIYNYAGFFHFLGRIIQAPTEANLYFNILDSFKVNFNTENALVPESFPKPLVQLDFFDLELPRLFNLPANELFKQLHPEKI